MGSQSHPLRSNKGAILSSRTQRKGKKPGSEYHRNPGLSLPTCNHLPLSLSLLNPLLLYLSRREHASQIFGNIMVLSAPPLGRGPTTQAHLSSVAGCGRLILSNSIYPPLCGILRFLHLFQESLQFSFPPLWFNSSSSPWDSPLPYILKIKCKLKIKYILKIKCKLNKNCKLKIKCILKITYCNDKSRHFLEVGTPLQ